jgi:hypothetical protein
MRDFKDLREKTLTPAEKKKREEIAKAMERENPGMDMKKKMAIATWQAKKVAEETIEESIAKMSNARLKFHATKNFPHGSYTRKEIEDEHKRRMKTEPLYHQVKASLNEEVEEIDEISRDLARRYIRKVADKTNTGELSTKQVMKRKPGVTLAGKKAYPGVAGEPKVRATESVEQIDEISDKKLDAYRQKAFADQPSGDDGSDKYRKRKFGRDLAFDKQTGRAKVRATKEEVELDELNKSTLGSYIKKASTNQIGNTAKVLAGKNDPDTERARKRMGQRMSGIAKATDKLTKEEAEQIDELSKKTLGSYVKKAKDDLGNREAEVTRNRYVDPRGVKDPVKHNNALLMKRANRRDNINKAVDKLTKEEVENLDELKKSTLGSYVNRAADDISHIQRDITSTGTQSPDYKNLSRMRRNRKGGIATAVKKLTKEQSEDDMAASPDEASMAMRQLDFIEDAAEKIKDRIGSGKGFPEWMQNKLSKLHGQMESLYSSLGELEDEDDMEDEMEEEVKSSDKKPEKYTRPDGKVAFRMVSTDKKVIKND